MPPRARKTASPARSSSSSRRTSTAKPAFSDEPSSTHASSQPDPVAVQRLIEEAMARAAARRTSTPAGRTAQAAQPAPVRPHGNGFVLSRAFSRVFPARPSIYSAQVTATLTDLIGAFLVTCIAVYFTTAGYLFYREMALSS